MAYDHPAAAWPEEHAQASLRWDGPSLSIDTNLIALERAPPRSPHRRLLRTLGAIWQLSKLRGSAPEKRVGTAHGP